MKSFLRQNEQETFHFPSLIENFEVMIFFETWIYIGGGNI